MLKKMKLNALAATLMLASGAANANVVSFNNIVSESVGTEYGAFRGKANIAGDSITLDFSADLAAGDLIKLSLDNGALFADKGYTLEQSAGGAGTGNLTFASLLDGNPQGKSEITFRAVKNISASDDFILSGSTIAGQSINATMPAASAGTAIKLKAEPTTSFGTQLGSALLELFKFKDEFTSKVTTKADANIDVDAGFLTFTSNVKKDSIELSLSEATITNGIALNSDDKVEIVLTGDMSGIETLAVTSGGSTDRGKMTIDKTNNKASFEEDASKLFTDGSVEINATVDGKTVLSGRSFTLETLLNFDTEPTDALLEAGTDAGKWSINDAVQVKVSDLVLNHSGSVTWLKVVNEGTQDVDLEADIIWAASDNSKGEIKSASLGTVSSKSVRTISEAELLALVGNPEMTVDVTMFIEAVANADKVHIVAESKDEGGRRVIPVYMNTTYRDFTQ